MDTAVKSTVMAQVLRGIARNREPGWNFPGNFLELSFDEVAQDTSSVSVQTGAHCTGADGRLALAPMCVMADIALAAALRHRIGLAPRMATVQMSLAFTGAPMQGLVQANASVQGEALGAQPPQFFSRVTVSAGGVVGCVGSGTFIALGNRQGLSPMAMRKRADGPAPAPVLTPDDLDDEERKVWEQAVAADDGRPGFVDRFWGLQPSAVEGGAECLMRNGLHVGNRVGHTQGGISLALAAQTARCAAGAGWALTNVTGWYLAAGQGSLLRTTARALHRGSRTAAMECETRDEEGRLVLRAVTTHAKT